MLDAFPSSRSMRSVLRAESGAFRQLSVVWVLLLVSGWVLGQATSVLWQGGSFRPVAWLPALSTFDVWYLSPLLVPAFVWTGLVVYLAFVVAAGTDLRGAMVSGLLLAVGLVVVAHVYGHTGGPVAHLLAAWSIAVAVRRATGRPIGPTTFVLSFVPVVGATRLIEWAHLPASPGRRAWDWGALVGIAVIVSYVFLER